MENEKLIELTADIVSAHVVNNTVSVGDMPALVQRVYEALATLKSGGQESAPQDKTPVVSVRASIKPDFLVCMECGGKHKMLKRHLMNAHNMTPDQYRTDYGLTRDYPMVAPNYSEQRRALAHSIGLGRRRTGAGDGGGSASASASAGADSTGTQPSRGGRGRGAGKAGGGPARSGNGRRRKAG
jgi:predicted transcriptional regulator